MMAKEVNNRTTRSTAMPEKVITVSSTIFDILQRDKEHHTYSSEWFALQALVTVQKDGSDEKIEGVRINCRKLEGEDYRYCLQLD